MCLAGPLATALRTTRCGTNRLLRARAHFCTSAKTTAQIDASLRDLLLELEPEKPVKGKQRKKRSSNITVAAPLVEPGAPRKRPKSSSHRQSQVAAELRKALLEVLHQSDSELTNLAHLLKVTEVGRLLVHTDHTARP
jgi:hypothetical protein